MTLTTSYTLSDQEQFFYDHAGYSHAPDESAENGRVRCAILLADAEKWAERNHVSYGWEDDWDIGSHVREFDAYDKEPETCEYCMARMDGEVVASLGCIDDATPEYRRVIEAELASEAMK